MNEVSWSYTRLTYLQPIRKCFMQNSGKLWDLAGRIHYVWDCWVVKLEIKLRCWFWEECCKCFVFQFSSQWTVHAFCINGLPQVRGQTHMHGSLNCNLIIFLNQSVTHLFESVGDSCWTWLPCFEGRRNQMDMLLLHRHFWESQQACILLLLDIPPTCLFC